MLEGRGEGAGEGRCAASPPAAALTLGCELGWRTVRGRRILLPVPVRAIHEGGGAVLSHYEKTDTVKVVH